MSDGDILLLCSALYIGAAAFCIYEGLKCKQAIKKFHEIIDELKAARKVVAAAKRHRFMLRTCHEAECMCCDCELRKSLNDYDETVKERNRDRS